MENYNNTALIGYTGFVGSNLYYDFEFTDVYNSKNITDITNKSYDLVVCAGFSAMKWWANLNPEEDLKQINSLIEILKTVSIKKFVLISTIDVYDEIDSEHNETYVSSANNHAYGRNRLYVEQFVKNRFNYLIVRLPGLFGYGIKKNIIYDFLNDKMFVLDMSSQFQWYYVSNILKDIEEALECDINILNLFTEPVSNEDLYNLFKKYKKCDNIKLTYNETIKYNCTTKYTKTGYYYSKEIVLQYLDKFINQQLNSRLIISNLSWINTDNLSMMVILKDYGIKELEIAPSKYSYENIPIYSYQSLLYPMTDNLFGHPEEMDNIYNRLIEIIDLASKTNSKVLIFGSPKNRIKDNLTYKDAMVLATGFFRQIAEYAKSKNVIFCIEPNSKKYGCDFITNIKEGNELVEAVNSPNFKLNFDVGNILMEKEDPYDLLIKYYKNIGHIQFSAPYLSYLDNNIFDYNSLYSSIMTWYTGYISIEMLNQSNYNIVKSIRSCIC